MQTSERRLPDAKLRLSSFFAFLTPKQRGAEPPRNGRSVVNVALLLLLLAFGLAGNALAQELPYEALPAEPLPQDGGTDGLKQMLRRLGTTARLMQVVAHPDDEDGGMLTLESRGQGATVTLMTLTRGEGGQNKVGGNLFDGLGVLRTLELTASDRYYGVEQRFSRVADFGFSKSADETFQKWQGHDVALGDIVRVIRTFRPEVLIARFSGTPRDGHGHHQASSILTQEAFRAAADPNRFPDQIKQGLQPWQAKKLYVGNVCGFFAPTCADENYTIRLNTGVKDPVLGMSYIQFAMEGLRHQLSQGAGGWSVEPGDRFTYYKLADTTLPGVDAKKHEQSLFDGIDTSLAGVVSLLGVESGKSAWLRSELEEIAKDVSDAVKAAEKDQSRAAISLHDALDRLRTSISRLEVSDAPEPGRDAVLQILRGKQEQAQAALNLALNLTTEATVLFPQQETSTDSSAVSPGQRFAVSVKLHNGSTLPIQLREISLQGLPAHASKEVALIGPGKEYSLLFQVQLPTDFEVTRPFWHRDDPGRDSLYQVDNPKYATLPFPKYRFFVTAKYGLPAKPDGEAMGSSEELSQPVLMRASDEAGKSRKVPLSVVPPFSVLLDAPEQIVPVEDGNDRKLMVAVSANLDAPPKGELEMQVPVGWKAEPSRVTVDLHGRGSKKNCEIKLRPGNLKQGEATIRAEVIAAGKKYGEGYSLVTRNDLNAFYYYQPGIQRVSVIDVKVPHGLRVGYIMGAGDDIPTVLRQVGLDVTEIPAEKLATEDLRRFGTIVLGIRVYDTQKEVAANNKKLLEFVSAGGTLIVQYNASTGDFNGGKFTPYPANLSRARVSVEEAPVELLAPADGVFHFPNQITQKDFYNWVQERGLYFMDSWDSHYTPLLASNDPGEPPQKGGLLRTQYGKGTYIYTGYAFFRQLPAGVPGAVRLFVNLLAAGHEGSR